MSKTKKRKRSSSSSAGKTFASLIFSFLLALSLTVLGLLAVVKIGMTEEFVSRTFDQEYAEYVKAYVEEAAIDYTMPASIDTGVIDNLFDTNTILQDTRQAIHSVFAGQAFTPDTDALRKTLETRVHESLDEQGAAAEQREEVISSYVEEILDIYQNSFEITGLNAFVEIHNRFQILLWIGIGVFLLISVFLAVICVKIHHYAHRGLRYVAYGSGGAFLMTLAAPLAGFITRFYERIQITPQYVYHYLTGFISNVMLVCFLAAALWLLVTLVLIVIISAKRRRLIRGH